MGARSPATSGSRRARGAAEGPTASRGSARRAIRARHQAIELAWLWLRHQPDSALSREFLRRTAGASSRIRRIAIVALARKLMVALWRYLTTGLLPKGPWSRRKHQSTRQRHSAYRGQRGTDGDRATLGPTRQPFRRWVPFFWLPRRKHAECGYGQSSPTGYEVMQ